MERELNKTPPRNKSHLIQKIFDIWENVPKLFMERLYNSMPVRIAAVKNKGFMTKYEFRGDSFSINWVRMKIEGKKKCIDEASKMHSNYSVIRIILIRLFELFGYSNYSVIRIIRLFKLFGYSNYSVIRIVRLFGCSVIRIIRLFELFGYSDYSVIRIILLV